MKASTRVWWYVLGLAVLPSAAGAVVEDLTRVDWPLDSMGHPASAQVALDVRLGLHGEVIGRRVVRGSGYASFDRYALAALAGRRYGPRVVHGAAVTSHVQIVVDFRGRPGSEAGGQVRWLTLSSPAG